MNRRHTDLIMIDQGLVAPGNIPCECEHSKCEHSENGAPCKFFAERNVSFPGAGSFSLCVRCQDMYYYSGYRYGSDPRNRPVTIPSQSHEPDRLLSDELTSVNEYTRRERPGY